MALLLYSGTIAVLVTFQQLRPHPPKKKKLSRGGKSPTIRIQDDEGGVINQGRQHYIGLFGGI